MPPVASQVVAMTTNGAPGDDKAVQPAIPCFQFEKEKYSNNMVEKVLLYIAVDIGYLLESGTKIVNACLGRRESGLFVSSKNLQQYIQTRGWI